MKKITILISLLSLISLNVFSQYLFTMDISANQIKYDSKRDVIYAIVSGNDANYANSLVVINPYNGTVTNDLFIGSEPIEFEFTSDTNFVFAIFDNQPVVKKVDLNTFSIVESFGLGSDKSGESYYGISLATIPSSDSTIIVVRDIKSSSGRGGTAMYNNGKQLPKFIDEIYGPNKLVTTDCDTIYAFETDISSYNFYTVHATVDSGLTILDERNFISVRDPEFEGDFIFEDRGIVIDPTMPAQIGQYPLEDTWDTYPCQSDSKKNKVFFCKVNDNESDLDFFSYNRETFAKEASYTVPNIIPSDYSSPEASQLIRFGEKGLASIIYDDYYFSDKNPFISILNNSSFVDSIPPSDTSELAQLYILDTVYTYDHVTVYDTLDVYNYVTVYDTTHLSTTDTLIIYKTTTNVNGNIINSEISLYPNPASNYINVEITNSNVIENYNIKLYNTLGELFFDSQLTSDLLTIDISSYSKGTYILTLTNNWGQRIATKYVVVK
jgi:hypothetical protein